MRWIWIDRFVEFESGRQAAAIKNITLAEDHLHDHFPGYPVMPPSLITEGCAQTGGLLVGEQIQFREMVVLAKVPKAIFHQHAVPGDTLLYTATIEDVREDGAIVSATSEILPKVALTTQTCAEQRQLQAEMQIVFAFLRNPPEGGLALDAKDFVAMMKTLGVLDFTPTDGEPPAGLARLRALASQSAS